MKKKVDYTNFKLGQKVTCLRIESENEKGSFWEERLIVGEEYIIEDLEYRFPDRICVKLKGPYYTHSEFVPAEFFWDDIIEKRDKKINEILR